MRTHHTSIHTPQTPHVQTVIVLLEIDQQFGALEVPRGDPDVVLGPRVVEFGETPIDQSELFLFVVDHDVVGFDVSVHDSLGVAEVERLQVPDSSVRSEKGDGNRGFPRTDFEQLEDVKSHVEIGEFRV